MSFFYLFLSSIRECLFDVNIYTSLPLALTANLINRFFYLFLHTDKPKFEKQLHTNYFSNCIRRSYRQFAADICTCCFRPPVCFLVIFPAERPEYRFFVFLYLFGALGYLILGGVDLLAEDDVRRALGAHDRDLSLRPGKDYVRAQVFAAHAEI